ncbi:DUF397 domain-containing protein [Nocardiopsis sp. HNM0947]|uniref:DUF397 domain-containing protein n=1 Tax=Nocardiopsis coralli TaxID=2772213 RepID=A0ABR9P041_9ACTN|nr:DUF397 domain-containing protein [Nocardiopsis coralli]MBE2997195.1 DUF397 domain-containing protein [Nocardiopsis coralli]
MIDTEWGKSSYSGGAHQDCVECRRDGGIVQVRDTQNHAPELLAFPSEEWAAFITGVARDHEPE